MLVGPSGCGKTTTLRMLNRLEEPTSGEILIGGGRVTTQPLHELRRGIGYVIQDVGLFPHRTVADNIATVPRLLGWADDRVGGAGRRAASTSSISTAPCSTATPPSSPAASSSASGWPAPWPPTRRSC